MAKIRKYPESTLTDPKVPKVPTFGSVVYFRVSLSKSESTFFFYAARLYELTFGTFGTFGLFLLRDERRDGG